MIRSLFYIVKRYLQKRKLKTLLQELPGELQHEVMEELVALIDSPDRIEKVKKTREIFKVIAEKIRIDHDGQIAVLREEYASKTTKAARRVMTPHFPLLEAQINYDVLNEKVKARLTLKKLEDEILNFQKPNKVLMITALLGIMFSIAATYMTFRNRFGTDWAYGSEIISFAGNIFFTLTFNALEASTLYALFHFIPKRYSYGLSRLVGIISVLMILAAIVIIVITRTELGTQAIFAVQDLGRVE